MLEGRALVGETDMSHKMQDYAMLCAYEALDLHEVTEYEAIARFIKKACFRTFDFFYEVRQNIWNCMAMRSWVQFWIIYYPYQWNIYLFPRGEIGFSALQRCTFQGGTGSNGLCMW